MGRPIVTNRLRVCLGLLAAALGGGAAAAAPDALPGWRALVIGVDHRGGPVEVVGAVGGASDLADVLRRQGVAATQLVTGPQATRAAVTAAMDRLVAATGPDDDVVLAFDGLGLRDDPPAPGSLALTLVLADDRARPALGLTGADLTRFVRAVEARGGRVLLIADAAFGGAIPRRRPAAVSPDASPGLAASVDGGLAGAGAAPLFDRSLTLAASDLRFGSDSLSLPGRHGPGRLLTFAVARAIEARGLPRRGAAGFGSALVSYAARVVYQVSDQRQEIAALFGKANGTPGGPARTRGIVIKPTATLGAQAQAPSREAAVVETPTALFPHAGESDVAAGPIRIAAANGSPDQLAKLLPPTAEVRAVTRSEDPDLIWDPTFKNVLTPGGDLIADDVDRNAIPHIIDRTLALRQLKGLIVDAPQQVLLLPDDEVKQRGNVVRVVIGEAAGRSLVLFDIRSDGKVRLLYPRANDPPIITDARYELPLRISDPVGADTIVAVTGTQRLVELEQGLAAINGQKAPVAAVKLIHDAALPGTLVGSVSVFSSKP